MVVIRCPLCESEKTEHISLERFSSAIVEARKCLACGECFYVDDVGEEVKPPLP